MRLQWIVFILACLLSMGLLVIIFGQHQVWMMLKKGMEKLQVESETFDKIHAKEEFFMVTMEKLVFQGTKVADDLQSMVTKVKGAMDWKKTENDKCQEEKKTSADELAGKEKEHTDTEASFKSDTAAWDAELTSLKTQLREYRQICNYVNKNPLAMKLCESSVESPPPADEE